MSKKLGEVFDIPEVVHQGDFVLRLTEGLQADRRRQTLQQYVVTPQLVECFDQALSLVGSAVSGNSSKGAYLHGSFGSGKSHFMAVLDLILEGDADARAIPELAAVVTKHNRWWEGRKFLVVPFHMIGATSMESAILGGYAAFVRQRHPDAPTPGFYRSQGLIEGARQLRARLGEDKFFEALGGGGDDGWGTIGSGWDAAGFDAAASAAPDDQEHQRLVGALVDAFYSHLRQGTSAEVYLDLDRGLAVISRHAQGLGYAAVVLFLDELILWLASHSADQQFLNTEGQKVAKLVEAGDAGRPVPIVSFIARQRDLRELVGEAIPGAQQLAFADVLQWWEARFDKVVLEDRNLPAIIERRLLRVRDEQAQQVLHEAFERTAQVRREVLDILLTREGDRAMFEQVYPFSPALVQTLVALSGLLQRERTALKLMLQLLVQNRDRLRVGDVIPVGDLFDVILDGDEPFAPVIKRLFDRARDVWGRKFMPLLEDEHDVADEDVRAGRVDETIARRYRAHAGLLKTLLLSALAPEVESLRNLTPARLATLNHGTIRSPVPNGEATTVLTKMREWASHAGEIHISADAANPLISMQLAGVDAEGILENARSIDNFGNRVRMVKEILFRDLGIDPQGVGLLNPEYGFIWRGSSRVAELVLQNIRELPFDSFRPGDSHWRVLIDFPFDEGAHTPADDRARIQAYRDAHHESVRTLVWLPSFLNDRALADLGRLVMLNHVLSGQRLEEYGGHLQPGERSEARTILRNQRDQLEKRVGASLQQAYGIAQGVSNAVDTMHALDEHFESLYTGLRFQPPPGGSFRESLEHLLGQALAFEFPGHPAFETEIRRSVLKRVWAVIEQAVATPDGRIGMDRSVRDDVRRVVQPLQLGTCGEAHLVLNEHWRGHFEQQMARHGTQQPTVGQLRRWCNDPRPMGLHDAVSDLVVMTFAAQSGRSFYLHGAAIQPEIGGLNRECELRPQTLPPESEWTLAVERAGEVFGIAVSSARNASNVAGLVDGLRAAAREQSVPVANYAAGLEQRLKGYGLDASCNRARTAAACRLLLEGLGEAEGMTVVSRLAEANLDTSGAAMAAAMSKVNRLLDCLKSPEWEVIELIRKQASTRPEAESILSSMAAALRDDEHVTALQGQLTEQHRRALRLLEASAPPPPPPDPPTDEVVLPAASKFQIRQVVKRGVAAAGVREALQEVERLLAEDPQLRADVECRLFRAEDRDS